MNRRRTSKRLTNHLIAVLSMAMGRLNIRGHFTVQDGIWFLWQNGLGYSLSGLRSVNVTKDRQIILEFPAGALTLEPAEEVTVVKGLSTAANSQEARRKFSTRL